MGLIVLIIIIILLVGPSPGGRIAKTGVMDPAVSWGRS